MLALRVPAGGPNGSLSGTLRGQIKGKFGALMATWFQGASRGPKRDQFGVILGCLLESFWGVFLWTFVYRIRCFRLRLWRVHVICLITDCKNNLFLIVLIWLLNPVDVVEAAPPGAAEDHWTCWDMQTRGHYSCCSCVCSFCEWSSCETCFLQCSRLERASRSLAKTGLFFWLFFLFFCIGFLCVFWEALGGSLGGHEADSGAIWGPFWCHFGDFLGIRWVFKNVCLPR